jgi:hypothetical protein
MEWARILAYITGTVEKELLLRNEYLAAENRILRVRRAIYFVGVEEGAAAVFNGLYVHEFVHDSRHLLGFPCHQVRREVPGPVEMVRPVPSNCPDFVIATRSSPAIVPGAVIFM